MRLSNEQINTKYGLASYFFSKDINQIRRVRNALAYGMVGINIGSISNEKAPFGGIKESGLGREGSDDGIYEFLEPKCIKSVIISSIDSTFETFDFHIFGLFALQISVLLFHRYL